MRVEVTSPLGDASEHLVSDVYVDTSVVGTWTFSYMAHDYAAIFGVNSANNVRVQERTIEVVDTTPPEIVFKYTGDTRDVTLTAEATAFDHKEEHDEPSCARACVAQLWSSPVLTHRCAAYYWDADSARCHFFDSAVVDTNATTAAPARATAAPKYSAMANVGEEYVYECKYDAASFTEPGVACLDRVASFDATSNAVLPDKLAPHIFSNVKGNLPGIYNITYGCTDESGNTASKTRKIVVRDTVDPVVTFLAPMAHNQPEQDHLNDKEPGIAMTCFDACRGDCSLTGHEDNIRRQPVQQVLARNLNMTNATNTSRELVVIIGELNVNNFFNISRNRWRIVVPLATPAPTAPPTREAIKKDAPKKALRRLRDATDETTARTDAPTALSADDCCPEGMDCTPINDRTALLGEFATAYTMTDANGDVFSFCRSVLVEPEDVPTLNPNNGTLTTVEASWSPYVDAGALCSDLQDGIITAIWVNPEHSTVVSRSQPGTYHTVYMCKDSSDTLAVPATRTIVVQDTTPPRCAKLPDASTVEASFPYVDTGALCTDDLDGVIAARTYSWGKLVKPDQIVNTEHTGTYVITYRAQDVAGNWNADSVKHAERTVVVVDTLKPVMAMIQNGAVTHLTGTEGQPQSHLDFVKAALGTAGYHIHARVMSLFGNRRLRDLLW